MNNSSLIHNPVMLNEVIEGLNIQNDKIYVDCTFGLGGHSYEIIKKLGPNGQLIAIDRDMHAINLGQEKFKNYKNFSLFNKNYDEIESILSELKVPKITGGVLIDLGVSSLQLDDMERGFSFKYDSPLDMRMDNKQKISAYNVINETREAELADIIYIYGEERKSRQIARQIVNNRPIKTNHQLTTIILKCFSKDMRFRIHPATKTFQAIRIFVNGELDCLEKFLCKIPELLERSARLCVISFHSLEDRIVKHKLKDKINFVLVNKKPMIPTSDEMRLNPRSRSAKLRIAERI